MGAPAHVFHHVPKPIAPSEFRDAVLAACRPRFPSARFARPQRIALAISGGVDSMAMAYLFKTLLQTYNNIKIADNPVLSVHGVVIDHRLREGSAIEASSVCQELKKLGIRSFVRTLNWRQQRHQGLDPSTLPNVESVARTLRYHTLGNACRYLRATSLFFAHHRDDQYETVLMRLLAGHGYRGLQGIRDANAIPECYELHGVYKSGLLDDQKRRHPFLSFSPRGRDVRSLRLALKNAKDAEDWDQLESVLGFQEAMEQYSSPQGQTHGQGRIPYLAPLGIEDGGVMIYRPLLEFDKERLVATCEANNVPWFEDHTNTDPSLTQRNAIRHLTKTYELPRALQKPAILALSERARKRSNLQDAEARRMLVQNGVIRHFDPNAGTLLVRLPTLRTRPPRRNRWLDKARAEARIPLRRLIAAIAIQKLIAFVTPDRHLPPLANLENVVDRLFPELSDSPAADSADITAKSFAIAGVLFDPIPKGPRSLQWFLSRAPYPSNQPLPERKMPGYLNYRHGVLRLKGDGDDQACRYGGHWRSWKTAKIWDGRFWIRVSGCISARFEILPFLPAHAKPFRTALPRKERDRLERVLKHYAPGKVRYSLPALYSLEESEPGASVQSGGGREPVLTLLALPSLGIHVPGLERWVRYEARYKQVDLSLLSPVRKKPPSFGPRASSRVRTRRVRNRRIRINGAGQVAKEGKLRI